MQFLYRLHLTVHNFYDDGKFEYCPEANYNGTDSFRYVISDVISDTVTVIINVLPTNDLPIGKDDNYGLVKIQLFQYLTVWEFYQMTQMLMGIIYKGLLTLLNTDLLN